MVGGRAPAHRRGLVRGNPHRRRAGSGGARAGRQGGALGLFFLAKEREVERLVCREAVLRDVGHEVRKGGSPRPAHLSEVTRGHGVDVADGALIARVVHQRRERALLLRPCAEVIPARESGYFVVLWRSDEAKDSSELVLVVVDVRLAVACAGPRGVARQRHFPNEHLQNDTPDAPLVNERRVCPAPHYQLRRAVPERAELAIDLQIIRHAYCKPKIADLGFPVLENEDVRCLDVLVDDAALVDVRDRRQDVAAPLLDQLQ
eukprot:1965686-Rhodomonas_salina.2